MTRVTLAYPYTDPDGKTTEADKTVDLPEQAARDLLDFGRARTPDEKTPATRPAKRAAAKPKPTPTKAATPAETRKA